jgi:hypothetical protein
MIRFDKNNISLFSEIRGCYLCIVYIIVYIAGKFVFITKILFASVLGENIHILAEYLMQKMIIRLIFNYISSALMVSAKPFARDKLKILRTAIQNIDTQKSYLLFEMIINMKHVLNKNKITQLMSSKQYIYAQILRRKLHVKEDFDRCCICWRDEISYTFKGSFG